jgi:hypothetical protein
MNHRLASLDEYALIQLPSANKRHYVKLTHDRFGENWPLATEDPLPEERPPNLGQEVLRCDLHQGTEFTRNRIDVLKRLDHLFHVQAVVAVDEMGVMATTQTLTTFYLTSDI